MSGRVDRGGGRHFDRTSLGRLLERHGFVAKSVTYKTIWGIIEGSSSLGGSEGSRAALRRMGRFLLGLGRGRGAGGDTLRGVFVRI